ncbi:MAG: DUF4157 domain-containing protein [Deltaproteobacteria bacterium]|jgi:hypothetical protein|nr:DUF4157 domain-containing protein [Deltaproteobacteria bacterium]
MASRSKSASSEGSTISRLAGRLDRRELQRQSLPGGGTVFRGEIATRALSALGARAMTLDRSIIVGDDFDASKPEDQALFAHEQHHAEHGDGGGGGGGSNFRDAEEVAARAVERMVLHRAAAGGVEQGSGGGTSAPGGAGSGTNSADSAGGGTSSGARSAGGTPKDPRYKREPDPSRGYQALIADGWGHAEIIDMFAQRALKAQEEAEQTHRSRFGDVKGTL